MDEKRLRAYLTQEAPPPAVSERALAAEAARRGARCLAVAACVPALLYALAAVAAVVRIFCVSPRWGAAAAIVSLWGMSGGAALAAACLRMETAAQNKREGDILWLRQ